MRQEVFEKALKCFCPKAKIKEYNTWDRSRLDENDKWVKDSPALFVLSILASNFFDFKETPCQ